MNDINRTIHSLQSRALAAEMVAKKAEALSASMAAASASGRAPGSSKADYQVFLDLTDLRNALTAWRMVTPK